jgi:DNA-binding response OmpR family regulator
MNGPNKTVHEVLIVEDNRDAAESLAEYLRLNGFSVRVEYTGPAALAAALAEPPDAVLCDINLPGLNGFDVARRIRAAPQVQPILVAVTARRERDLIRPAAEAGFDHYFLKPADPVEICGFLCEQTAVAAGPPPARQDH